MTLHDSSYQLGGRCKRASARNGAPNLFSGKLATDDLEKIQLETSDLLEIEMETVLEEVSW